MKRVLIFLLVAPLISCAHSTAPTADAAAEVRQAEIDFARAFADRNVDRFASMIDEDAYFLSPRDTLHGRTEIMNTWSNLIRESEFSWEPERVVVSADGTLGLSTGPIRDAGGKVIGQYNSIWQRQADGSWRVVFDGPGSFCPPPQPAQTAAARKQYVYILRPARPEMFTTGPTQQEQEAMKGHVAYLQRLTADGTLLMAGRTQVDDPTTLGFAIFLASSDAEAAEIMKNDPGVKGGLMTATVHPYHIAFGTLAPQN